MWATCLGYDFIVAYTSGIGQKIWESFDYHKVSLPLEFQIPPEETKMYEGLGESAYEFEKGNFTYNSHKYGVSPDTFLNNMNLDKFWDITATSRMPNGTEFIASIESKNYPFFAT